MASIKTTMTLNDQVTKRFNTMYGSGNKVLSLFKNLKTKTVDPINSAGLRLGNSLLQQTKNHFSNIKNGVTTAKKEVDNFNHALNSSNKTGNNLASTMRNVVTAVAGFQGGKAILNLSDTVASMTARLDLMNDKSQTTVQLQDKIFKSAQRSRGAYQSTADAVSKMGILAGDAFKNNEEAIGFVEQLNKQFTISGTSQEGMQAAMLQITQAMGSGTLRGEELNSVLEQAPTIIQTIGKHLGKSVGEIRSMAADGEITSEVFKKAMLSSATETNKKFESMPRTFAQIWQSIKNQSLMAFQPILEKLNDIGNSKGFQNMVDNVVEVLGILGNKAVTVFNLITTNWGTISTVIKTITPPLLTVVGIMGTYNAIVKVSSALETISTAAKITHTLATQGSAVALKTAKKAQVGLNVSMLACPIFWIIAAIVAFVAIIALCAIKSETFRNTLMTAWNNIKTSLMTAWTFIQPVLIMLGDLFKQIAAAVMPIVQNIISFLIPVFTTIINIITSIIIPILATILKLAIKVISGIISALSPLLNFVAKITGKIAEFATFFKEEVVDKFIDFGKNMITGLWNGINDGIDWFKDKFKGFTNWIKEEFTNPMGINSPSTLFASYGRFIVQGLGKGITGSIGYALKAMDILSSKVSMGINPTIQSAVSINKDYPTGFEGDTDNSEYNYITTLPQTNTKKINQTKNNNNFEFNITITNEEEGRNFIDELQDMLDDEFDTTGGALVNV